MPRDAPAGVRSARARSRETGAALLACVPEGPPPPAQRDVSVAASSCRRRYRAWPSADRPTTDISRTKQGSMSDSHLDPAPRQRSLFGEDEALERRAARAERELFTAVKMAPGRCPACLHAFRRPEDALSAYPGAQRRFPAAARHGEGLPRDLDLHGARRRGRYVRSAARRPRDRVRQVRPLRQRHASAPARRADLRDARGRDARV